MTPAFNVLFLCTHNSARSIMAEAILQKVRRQAGSVPTPPGPIQSPRRMPEVIDKLRAFGHDTDGLRSKSWHEFTGPQGAANGFRHHAMRHAGRSGLPRFRRPGGDRRLAAARSGQVHRQRGRTFGAAERAVRQPAPADRNLHVAALRLARPHGDEGAARRYRRRTARPGAECADRCASASTAWAASAAWRCAPRWAACTGRPTIRARTTASTSCMSTNSRAARRPPRTCWNSTASTAAGASAFSAEDDRAIHHRQPAHRLQRRADGGWRRLGRSGLRHRAGMHRQVPEAGAVGRILRARRRSA